MPKPANPRKMLKTTQFGNVKALVSPPKKTIIRDGNRALSLPKVSATRPRTKAPSKVQRYRTKPRASSLLNGACVYKQKQK